MSEFHFFAGTCRGKVGTRTAQRASKIARENGCAFVTVTLPGDGPRHWFAGRSYGHPFDGATAKSVRDALDAAGVVLP